MATTDHGPNKYKYKNKHIKPNNFIKHNYNNNNNNLYIYNLLLKTAASQINTVLYTTLKALFLSTFLPHHHNQQPSTTTTPTINNNSIYNKPPLLPPSPNIRWHIAVSTFQAHLTKIFELD